jgi:2-polyprenyl-3-methyl-5-hydroxy-6-metoxy-1,4-benzoquinol methylase
MLKHRASGPELMDGPEFGFDEAVDTFRFLVEANRWFGGIRPVVSFFERESRAWDHHGTYRLLDAGGGVGDVAVALVRWARRTGRRIRVDLVDKDPNAIELGRQACRGFPEISAKCQDVLDLKGREYDYVYASQFLHHFGDEEVVPVLRRLLRICRRKVLISDLVRAPLAYLATWFITLFTSPVFRHDARMSVRRGFRADELEALLRDGGLCDFALEKHFFYRVLLVVDQGAAGRQPSQSQTER